MKKVLISALAIVMPLTLAACGHQKAVSEAYTVTTATLEPERLSEKYVQ